METQSDISHLLIDGKENTVEGEEVRSFIGAGGSVLQGEVLCKRGLGGHG